jgi:hypothetical protein
MLTQAVSGVELVVIPDTGMAVGVFTHAVEVARCCSHSSLLTNQAGRSDALGSRLQ